jgi:signal transduction histidine kinase
MFCDKPRLRFSHRVFKVFALSLLAVSAIFTTYFLYVQQQRLESALVDRSRGLGGLLATGAKIAVYSENPELVRETLHGVVDRRDVLSAAVFTIDRALVAAEGRSPALTAGASQLTPRDIAAAQRLGAESGCATLQNGAVVDTLCPVQIRKRAASEQDLYFESPQEAAGEETVGFVKITLDRRPMRRELRVLALRSLLLLALILVLGSWAGLVFSRRVTEPLERLTEAVRAFGAGGQVRELTRMPEDEIGRLAEAFTNMTRDIVEREREQARLEERLRNAQKMEAVGTLSQGISHDFKNILSTLKAAVHILQKGSPGNEFVLRYTEKMQTSLDRARDLVDRLVSFSRTRQLPASPVDLSALLERLAPMLCEAVGESVRLNVEHPGRPVRILGDAPSIEQLLLNLAYNARDAMHEGGILCVRLETAAGTGAGGEGVARLLVQDTGLGMDPAVRRRLFEPFFTTKEVGAGSGLGLSIVHGIVEQHRGRIEVESELGEGALFRIELPLLPERETGTEGGGHCEHSEAT